MEKSEDRVFRAERAGMSDGGDAGRGKELNNFECYHCWNESLLDTDKCNL